MHLAAEKRATSKLARPALQSGIRFVASCCSCAHAIVGLYVVPCIIPCVGITSNVLKRTSSPTIVMHDLCDIGEFDIVVAHTRNDRLAG